MPLTKRINRRRLRGRPHNLLFPSPSPFPLLHLSHHHWLFRHSLQNNCLFNHWLLHHRLLRFKRTYRRRFRGRPHLNIIFILKLISWLLKNRAHNHRSLLFHRNHRSLWFHKNPGNLLLHRFLWQSVSAALLRINLPPNLLSIILRLFRPRPPPSRPHLLFIVLISHLLDLYLHIIPRKHQHSKDHCTTNKAISTRHFPLFKPRQT